MRESQAPSHSSRILLVGAVLVLGLAGAALWLADPDFSPLRGPVTIAHGPDPSAPAGADGQGPPLSPAERIGRLQRSIDADQKYLDSLNAQLSDPNNEFHWAEKNFQKVDAERQQAIQDKGADAAKDLEARWQQARQRFNLAITERKTLQETVAALTAKLQADRGALDRLTGVSPAAGTPAPLPAGVRDSAPAAPKPADAPPAAPRPSEPAGRPADSGAVPAGLAHTAGVSPPAPAPAAAEAPAADNVPREVLRAREEAKARQDEANKAENKARAITTRLEELQKNIALARKLFETARQQADQEEQAGAALEQELKQKTAAGAPEADVKDVTRRLEWSRQRLQKAQAEVRSTTDRLDALQDELSTVQAEQIAALRDAESRRQTAEAAEDRVNELQNPFRLRNIAQWLLRHGPRLLLIALGMLLAHRFTRALSRRVVTVLARGGAKRGTREDRENRAQTLAGVFTSAASLLILGGGALMILDEAGIPIVPLMGGAAVVGLAVAFGAQNLIKDYFSGFMVLLEDQYGINDVVRIGAISGMVEHISLRTTVLRDLEGVVHFVPHGTITTVSNLTHGWSRALFDVHVPYKDDVDHVMRVLLDLGHELRRDPAFGPLILDDPQMLGVDHLADASVTIKFFLKTRPLQQWTVKREMLRRIKNKFDALGVGGTAAAAKAHPSEAA
jgi:small conductance mechanosensitive channel